MKNTVKVTAVGIAKFRYNRRNAHIGLSEQAPGPVSYTHLVDVFRHTRILQIAPRPFDFWSTMCNEGELLAKFNIQLSPIPMPELTAEMKQVKEEGLEVEKVVAYCMNCLLYTSCVSPAPFLLRAFVRYRASDSIS